MAIPRRVITYWINHNPDSMPKNAKKCIESQRRMCEKYGYEHVVLTIDDCNIGNKYVDECLSRKDVKGYVKASDIIRCWYAYNLGGFILDADMAILDGKNFNHLLDNTMVVPRDPQGHYANAAFGCEAGVPILKEYIRRITDNFRGDGDLVYDPGIRGFSDCFYVCDTSYIKIIDYDFAFPYNHLTGEENVTENTIIRHEYNNSWVDKSS